LIFAATLITNGIHNEIEIDGNNKEMLPLTRTILTWGTAGKRKRKVSGIVDCPLLKVMEE